MPGPWKARKSKSSFPTPPTVPWKSRRRREISTFPQPSFAVMGKWKTKGRFPTFPQPLATITSSLFKPPKTKERKSAAKRPLHFPPIVLPSGERTDFMLIFQLENATTILKGHELVIQPKQRLS